MSLTVCFITSRDKPRVEWFLDSLALQTRSDEKIKVIIVDLHDGCRAGLMIKNGQWGFAVNGDYPFEIDSVGAKPTVWQGPHRITKSGWWAKASALNTALCLCRTDFFAAVDDRCVLAPGWLDSVHEAMAGNYAVCGAYEKRVGMKVENGEIVDPGTVTGTDHRLEGHLPRARYCIPGWFFGCSIALPTEWALQVNGWNELLDGLGAEDTHFGHMLKNNGFDIRFDPRKKVIQDRTPGECGPEMKRSSKERFSHDADDKGHKAIELFFGEKQSSHPWKIREIRESVLAGGEWPSVEKYPAFDWFDGQPITEFE